MDQKEVLKKLSDIDTDLLRSKRSLDDLPEAAQIMECRAKRKELKGKQDQVIELTDDVDAKLEKLQKEEEAVIAKLKDLQDTIDHSSDYRVTSAATRDMEGQIKRQGSLSKEQDELLERQIKIDHLANQVADMLAALDHKEHHLTEDFKEKGGAIKQRIEELNAQRAELLAQLDGGLARRYERLREEKGGIGVAFMVDNMCSVCRTKLLTGQLAKLKDGPEITECPNCHRLFVVER